MLTQSLRATEQQIGSVDNVTATFSALRHEDPAFDRALNVQRFKRNDTVATPDSLLDNMYLLMEGEVNLICQNRQNRRLVITTLRPGAVFGQGVLHEPSDVNTSVEAAGNVTVWQMPAADARNMVMQHPILSWSLLQTYGERLAQVESGLEDIAYKKLPARLAALLLELSNFEEGAVRGFSHQALADYLGTYRETVSAALREFKRQEFVELGYRYLRIVNAQALKDIAGIW